MKKISSKFEKKKSEKKKFSTIKFVRINNYISKEINNNNKIIIKIKIKLTNKFSLF